MSTPITMPQLGESVTEGVVSRWLKAEGDRVERDEPLLEIITDKVTAEMPSPVSGTLVEILAVEGATVTVGREIARVDVRDAVPAGAPSVEAGVASDASVATDHPLDPLSAPGGRKRYSPLVKRLAQEHDLDLTQIGGSGIAGRVTKDDVLSYIAARQERSTDAHHAAEEARVDGSIHQRDTVAGDAPRAPATDTRDSPEVAPRPLGPAVAAGGAETTGIVTTPGANADEEYVPLTPMRRAIAEHMVRSKREAPHATAVIEVDMSRFVRWRAANKDGAIERYGVDITYDAFLIQAVAAALRSFPLVNSSWGGDRIVVKRRINIGVAVGLEDGLVVPVIRDADEKNVVGLARAVADLANRARANRLTPRDVDGGTFTVNNVGVFGTVLSTPVIAQPQAAILAMNAIVKRAVVQDDDSIAVRSMMNLSMSFDHRVVDGLMAGRFMQSVAHHLQATDVSSI